MIPATPRSSSIPHAAATSPNLRWRVRSGNAAASRASSKASMSAADPRYRSETSFGLPSTQPISRRYQYGFPLMIFLYRLAMTHPGSQNDMLTLGHRRSRGQVNTTRHVVAGQARFAHCPSLQDQLSPETEASSKSPLRNRRPG